MVDLDSDGIDDRLVADARRQRDIEIPPVDVGFVVYFDDETFSSAPLRQNLKPRGWTVDRLPAIEESLERALQEAEAKLYREL